MTTGGKQAKVSHGLSTARGLPEGSDRACGSCAKRLVPGAWCLVPSA